MGTETVQRRNSTDLTNDTETKNGSNTSRLWNMVCSICRSIKDLFTSCCRRQQSDSQLNQRNIQNISSSSSLSSTSVTTEKTTTISSQNIVPFPKPPTPKAVPVEVLEVAYKELLKVEPTMRIVLQAARKCGFEWDKFSVDQDRDGSNRKLLSDNVFPSDKKNEKEFDPAFRAASGLIERIIKELGPNYKDVLKVSDRSKGYGIGVTNRELLKADYLTYKVTRDQAESILFSKEIGSWLLRRNGENQLSISSVIFDSTATYSEGKEIKHTSAISGSTIEDIARNAGVALEKRVVPQYDKFVFLSFGTEESVKDHQKQLYKKGVVADIIDLRSYDRGKNEGNLTEEGLQENLSKQLKQLTPQSCCYFIGQCLPGIHYSKQLLVSDRYTDTELASRMNRDLHRIGYTDFPLGVNPNYSAIKAVWDAHKRPDISSRDTLSIDQIVSYFTTYAPQLINKYWKKGDPRIEINISACFTGKEEGGGRESFPVQLGLALERANIPAIIRASETEVNRIKMNPGPKINYYDQDNSRKSPRYFGDAEASMFTIVNS